MSSQNESISRRMQQVTSNYEYAAQARWSRFYLVQVHCLLFWLLYSNLTIFGAQVLAEDDQTEDRRQTTIQKSDVLSIHKRSTAAVCFSPRGLLATTSVDRTARLWDMKQRRTVATLTDLPRIKEGTWDSDVAVSPDGRLLAVAVSGKSIQVWEADRARELWRTDNGARSLAFAPNGKTLVTADWEDPLIKVWDAGTGKLLKTLNGTAETIKSGCWSQGTVVYAPDGKTFATAVGGADQGVRFPTELRIWDAETLSVQQKLVAQPVRIHAMAYSPDGRMLAVGGVGGTVRLFKFPLKPKAKVDVAVVKRLIAGLDDDRFATRENAQEQLMKLGPAAEKSLQEAKGTATSDEVRFRINAILGAIAKETTPKKVTIPGRCHDGTIMGLAFSPDGKLLSSCSREYLKGRGRIVVWKTEDTAQPVFQWNGPGVTSIRFSPDGSYMASSGQDGPVTLWTLKREDSVTDR